MTTALRQTASSSLPSSTGAVGAATAVATVGAGPEAGSASPPRPACGVALEMRLAEASVGDAGFGEAASSASAVARPTADIIGGALRSGRELPRWTDSGEEWLQKVGRQVLPRTPIAGLM